MLMLRSMLYNVKVKSAMNYLLGSDFLSVKKNVYCRQLSIETVLSQEIKVIADPYP